MRAEARCLRTTRSGLLRSYVDEGLRRRSEERARRIDEIMSSAHAVRCGGRGVDELKR